MEDKRLINRIEVDDFKVQFKIDGVFEPFCRKVENISFKGISFNKINKDVLLVNKEYEFILSRDNKFILGKACIVHENEHRYGMYFIHIDNDHYKVLCDFLDPAYAGKNLELVKDIKKDDYINLKYQALKSGLTFEYNKSKNTENFEFYFVDKYLSYSREEGLKVGSIEDYQGDIVYIVSKNSVYFDVINNFKILVSSSLIDNSIKKRVLELIC